MQKKKAIKPVKKPEVLYVDIVDAACKSGEAVFELKKDQLDDYIATNYADVKTSIEAIYSEMATLYCMFRRLGVHPIAATVRVRQGLLKMAENELNLKPFDLTDLLKPIEKAKVEELVIIGVDLAKEGDDSSYEIRTKDGMEYVWEKGKPEPEVVNVNGTKELRFPGAPAKMNGHA